MLGGAIRLRDSGSGGFWAFDVESGSHYELNPTAFWILENVGGGDRRAAEVLEQLLLEFDVDAEQGAHDLQEAIRAFVNMGLLREKE